MGAAARVLVVAAVLCAAVAQSVEAGRRKTLFTGQTLSDRLGGYDEATDSFDWGAYGIYVGERFALALVVGIVSILAIPVFLCIRCLCNCCGGRKPSYGICRGPRTRNVGGTTRSGSGVTRVDGKRVAEGSFVERNGTDVPKTYSLKSVLVLKIVALVVAGIIVVSIGLVFGGSTQVSKGLNGLVDAVVTTGVELVADVERIVDDLVALPYTTDAGAETADSLAEARAILEDARTIGKDRVKTADKYRSYFLYVCCILPVIFLGIGIILGVVGITTFQIQIVCAMITLLIVFILWLSIGLHIIFSIVFADVCTEVDIQLGGGSGTNVIGDALGCGETNDKFASITEQSSSGLADAVDAACTRAAQICSDPTAVCPKPCSNSTVDEHADNLIEGGSGPITWTACASTCADANRREITSAFITDLGIIASYRAIDVDARSVLNCNFMDTLVARLKAALCSDFLGGINLVLYGQISLAVAIYAGIVVLVLGVKRFNRSNHTGSTSAVVAPAAAPAGMPMYSYSLSDSSYDAPPPYDKPLYPPPPRGNW